MAVNESNLINAAIQLEVIDAESVSILRQQARRERLKLLDVVMREKRLPLTAFYQSLAVQRNMPFLTLAELQVDEVLLKRIPTNLLSRRLLLPVTKQGKVLLAVADPDDQVSVDSVRRILGGSVEAALAEPIALKSALQLALGENSDRTEEGEPVVLLDQIMQDAYIRRASDIHFEPERIGLKVRMRVDGHLQDYPRFFSRAEADGLLNRIKVLSGLDISESRMPQDGGFGYHIDAWDVPQTDIRLATIPSRFGERATMRILGQADEQLGLDDLGMPAELLEAFREKLLQPHGIVLVTGPTGSGKSTTLYGALREIDKSEHNVLTVEDPIEQVIEGVTQVQVSNKVSFSSALRSFLRHDPDIILVGEIRDLETADTALKAAMTGHLVLSTLHTNDAASAATRLADLGSENYLIASTLVGVLAQRLVRRLCTHCREPHSVDEQQQQLLDVSVGVTIYRPKGCPSCLSSGYSGRVGLYEAMWVDEELAQAIAQGNNSFELRKKAKYLQSLWHDARSKVLDGVTSIDEVMMLAYQRESAL